MKTLPVTVRQAHERNLISITFNYSRQSIVDSTSRLVLGMECKSIKKNKQNVITITSPEEVEAALNGILTIKGKPVLVIRGNDCQRTVVQIFCEFTKHNDRTNHAFTWSLKRRGLTEIDVYGNRAKITPANLERYILEWFRICELFTFNAGRVLILVDKLSRMNAQLWLQTRFTAPVAELFDITTD